MMNGYRNPLRTVYKASGNDLLDLINRISTHDTLTTMPVNTILVNEKARVEDILSFTPTADSGVYWMACRRGQETLDWIDKFVFTEDVSFTPADVEVITVMTDTAQADALQFELFGLPNLIVSPGVVPGDITLVEATAYHAYRIQHLIPEFDREVTGAFNPLELGLIDYISFSKGCYIGQEVIARLDTYKKVSKFPARVESDQNIGHTTGGVIMDDEKRVGIVTSASDNQAFAVVHKSVALEGRKVVINSDKGSYEATITAAITDRSYQRI